MSLFNIFIWNLQNLNFVDLSQPCCVPNKRRSVQTAYLMLIHLWKKSVEPTKLIRNSIRVSGQFKFLESQRNRHKIVTTERPLHTIVSKIVKRQVQTKNRICL